MRYTCAVLAVFLLGMLGGPGDAVAQPLKIFSVSEGAYVMSEKVVKTDKEWKALLDPDQFHVLREQATERAYSGKLWNNHDHGVYRCAGCGLDLFHSADKYDSGTGWPSFYKPVAGENVELRSDRTLFLERTEVLCVRCGGHLGHVFDDGPASSGKRYCMNSAALRFEAAK